MPISIVKALIEGKPPARLLFMPLIFALAAKLEDVPLSNFVANPTKIANSLVAIYQRLRPDGVTCYFDLFLIAEVLGCRLDWCTSPPVLQKPAREAALKMLRQPQGEVKQRGRLPVALEVVHRVQGTLRNGPALVVGLPGPLRLAQQTFGQDVLQALAKGEDDVLDGFEMLVEIILSVARAFCLAGTHLLYFDELDVPTEFLSDWEAALVALWKTVRFHGALPVLSTPRPLQFEDQANAPLICLKPAPDEQAPLSEIPFALALPVLGEAFPDVSRWMRAKQCALVTTDGEIPYQLEIQKLEQRVAAMRSLFGS
ncbi:MAG: uroporphyrinogen decarboxylase family protein [Ktedonobacteraceae bacterium]